MLVSPSPQPPSSWMASLWVSNITTHQKGTNVQVLGWDYKTRQGLEVGNFESTDDGRKMGEQLMDEGADIIMPVAGPVGLGTLAVMEERDSGMLIGVDNDWSLANPDKAKYHPLQRHEEHGHLCYRNHRYGSLMVLSKAKTGLVTSIMAVLA